jgi:LysM repeat protein
VSNIVAFIINNLLLVVAGGFVAVWLAWRMWQKVEGIARTTNDMWALAFWAFRLMVIVAVLFRVGGWIYANVNSAVIAAVNSTSVQTSGQALVALAGGVDSVFSADIASSISGGAQAVNLIVPSVNTPESQSIALPPAALPVQPGAIPINSPEDAVTAFNALMAPTPEAIVYINEFVADNSPTVAAVTTAGNGGYVVKRGDSLAKIAKAFYGDSKKWRSICDANRGVIRDCNNIAVGITLVIPASGGAAPPDRVVSTGSVVAQPAPVFQPATSNPVVVNSYVDAVKMVQALAPAVPVQRQIAPAAVPVQPVQQQIVSAADAVSVMNAVQPTKAPAVAIPAVVVQAIAKPTQTADEYIAQFLETNNNNTVASAGN